MNILVINLCLRPYSVVKFFPIGLGYIVTAMKNAGYDFDLLDIDLHRYSDEEVLNYIKKKKYDVICMGAIVTGYKYVKNLSLEIKKIYPDSIIISGNSVATSIPEILLKNTGVDVGVLGEGDITIVEVLDAIKNKKDFSGVQGICYKFEKEIKYTPKRPPIKDISAIPNLDYSIFDIELYIENSKNWCNDTILEIPRDKVRGLPINTARGCVANCGFCYHVFKGVVYRYRNASALVNEIKTLIQKYSLTHAIFFDELTFFSKKQTYEFVQKLIDEKIKIYWDGTCRANLFDSEEDIELIKMMKLAGCTSISYSLESSNADILKEMNKNCTVEQFEYQTQLIHKAGLPVLTSLVFGYPTETPETIRKTIQCCIDNKIYPSSGYLLPQPGSKVYDYAIEKGFIKDEEEYVLKMGDRQDLRINLTRMSDEEFVSCVSSELKRCNEALKMGLNNESLLKTQYYRAPKKIN